MASIEVANLSYALPGGRALFSDVSFRVPAGAHVALVGVNGVGKTTLLRILAGDLAPTEGVARVDGRVGVMRQFVATDPATTIRAFLIAQAPARLRQAAEALKDAEASAAAGRDDGTRYAEALAAWGEAGGYDAEVLWDTCTTIALGKPFDEVATRPVSTLSGGEQKRLALETLFRCDAGVLLLDEPDNFLDIPGKRWLEDKLNESRRTILFVSHDRALLANTAHKIVTVEAEDGWTHHDGYATYATARAARLARIEEEHRRFREEKERLTAAMKEFKRRAAVNDKFATKAQAMEKRIERFARDHAPRRRVRRQHVRMNIEGGRSGKLVVTLENFAIPGLVAPFSTEIRFGERVGIVGPNGAGKSHFLRLLAGEPIRHEGEWRLGARVTPSLFSQTHDRPDLDGAPIASVLLADGVERSRAMAALKRYELHGAAETPFSVLSGGQQARFQLLLIELASPTMLLLDEPTDNLDVDSAEALEAGLETYEGTVVAVTHDRWLMQLLDRFLVFGREGKVRETLESPYL